MPQTPTVADRFLYSEVVNGNVFSVENVLLVLDEGDMMLTSCFFGEYYLVMVRILYSRALTLRA
jgi:hypothetical protein